MSHAQTHGLYYYEVAAHSLSRESHRIAPPEGSITSRSLVTPPTLSLSLPLTVPCVTELLLTIAPVAANFSPLSIKHNKAHRRLPVGTPSYSNIAKERTVLGYLKLNFTGISNFTFLNSNTHTHFDTIHSLLNQLK